MQAVGLALAVFLGVLGAVTSVWAVGQWLFCSKHLAKVKVYILPGQEEKLEYTLRALRRLQEYGMLCVEQIQHQGIIERKEEGQKRDGDFRKAGSEL